MIDHHVAENRRGPARAGTQQARAARAVSSGEHTGIATAVQQCLIRSAIIYDGAAAAAAAAAASAAGAHRDTARYRVCVQVESQWGRRVTLYRASLPAFTKCAVPVASLRRRAALVLGFNWPSPQQILSSEGGWWFVVGPASGTVQ